MIEESNSLLSQLKNLESQFSYQAPAPDGDPWFVTGNGAVPVLVSAPHACMHSREGQDKMQEEYTGAIALYLAESCQCSVIATSYKTPQDPNWDEVSEYKSAVESLVAHNGIQLLIDLHGMTNRYGMGVAIGTMRGRACRPDLMLPHFVECGFEPGTANAPAPSRAWRRVVVDHPKFTGGLVNHTVTRYASQQLNIPSVQIELASEVRVVESHMKEALPDWPQDYYGCPNAIQAAVGALQSLVKTYV